MIVQYVFNPFTGTLDPVNVTNFIMLETGYYLLTEASYMLTL